MYILLIDKRLGRQTLTKVFTVLCTVHWQPSSYLALAAAGRVCSEGSLVWPALAASVLAAITDQAGTEHSQSSRDLISQFTSYRKADTPRKSPPDLTLLFLYRPVQDGLHWN